MAGLGLHPAHPRWLGGPVLDLESVLLTTAGAVPDPLLPDDPLLGPVAGRLTGHGADRWDRVSGRSFFDDEPAGVGPARREPAPGRGRASAACAEVGLAVRARPDVVVEGERCRRRGAAAAPTAARLRAVPRRAGAGDLRGRRAVRAPGRPVRARRDHRPPGAAGRRSRTSAAGSWRCSTSRSSSRPRPIARWRARFDSAYAAAYHPWLGVPRTRRPGGWCSSPPSAFAAGIIAARERRLGLPWGPANELARGAVTRGDRGHRRRARPSCTGSASTSSVPSVTGSG